MASCAYVLPVTNQGFPEFHLINAEPTPVTQKEEQVCLCLCSYVSNQGAFPLFRPSAAFSSNMAPMAVNDHESLVKWTSTSQAATMLTR